jgi:hypothetical protein
MLIQGLTLLTRTPEVTYSNLGWLTDHAVEAFHVLVGPSTQTTGYLKLIHDHCLP